MAGCHGCGALAHCLEAKHQQALELVVQLAQQDHLLVVPGHHLGLLTTSSTPAGTAIISTHWFKVGTFDGPPHWSSSSTHHHRDAKLTAV